MGTQSFLHAVLPDGTTGGGLKRQLEIVRPAGEDHLILRIGEPGEQNMPRGFSVRLDEANARELLQALGEGMRHLALTKENAD